MNITGHVDHDGTLVLTDRGITLALLGPRLLSLAEQTRYAPELYDEDGSINAEIAFKAVESFWYDGFVRMYTNGCDFDRLDAELQQEFDQANERWLAAQKRESKIESALSLIDGVTEGTIRSPSSSSLKGPPATLPELKEEIIRKLCAYGLPYRLENADALRAEAEHQLVGIHRRVKEAEQAWHVTTWRQSILKRASVNCRHWGDLRPWHELYDEAAGHKPARGEAERRANVPGQKPIQEGDPKQIREVMEEVLDFTEGLQMDGDLPAFRELVEPVSERIHLSKWGTRDAIVRAADRLRTECGADVPRPNQRVAYYVEYRRPLKEALETYKRLFLGAR